MEVISSQALWKEYDRKSLPLNVSVVSEKEENGAIVTRFYFSGAASPDGVTRVYARLVRPSAGVLPVVVVLGDLYDSADSLTFDAGGRAVLYIDYSGRKEAARFTLYPEGMRFAEPYYTPDTLKALPASPGKTCWYVWGTVVLRAMTYIESDPNLDASAAAVVGIGTGGAQVWKALCTLSVRGGVIINERGGKLDDTGFKAGLDSVSYAGRITAPLLCLCCSNGDDLSIDQLSETIAAAAPECLLSVRPRAFRGTNEKQRRSVEIFLDKIFGGGTLPARPKLTARASEGALYCELASAAPVGDPRLYTAHSSEKPSLRNWQCVRMEKAGEGDYIARVGVTDASEPIRLFAIVETEDGLALSSELVEATPAAMGIAAAQLKKNRLIYDGDMGVDDWIGGDGDEAETGEGPFGIGGVTAESALSTFKISDSAYSGEDGYVLQMLAYSEADQTVTVNAVTKSGEVYFTLRELKTNDEWTKLSFNVTDFKSAEGSLDSWDKIAAISMLYGARVIVNSMLWV